jgi:DNA-binding NarL/FixJ family response regulator
VNVAEDTIPLRVLIADDHPPTRDDVRRALEADARFSVCAEAADAAGAVQAAVRELPDICVLDIRMPGGGIAAAWEILARLPQAKVVMLTVSDEDSDLFSALGAGADGYLLKTMNLARLPNTLAGLSSGETAMQRTLVARMVERFHEREPRWRRLVENGHMQAKLTSRQWQVLELLAQGCTTNEIAHRLVLSRSGVRVHIAAIVRKLEVENRAEAVKLFGRSET